MQDFFFPPSPTEVQLRTYEEIKKGFPDVRRAIKEQTEDYNYTLTRLSEEERENTRNSMAEVCGTVEAGFDHLTRTIEESLCDASQGLYEIGRVLDWGFTMVISQLNVTNILAENIALLLRIPDMQKERRYYIEQGLKHYRNAGRDDDLYADSLKNLMKAEALEETDYFVLFHIGLVHLYSPNGAVRDLHKAEYYLLKAAKYASVEADPEACRLADLLVGNPQAGSLADQKPNTEAVQQFAAECYRQAAITCYIQGRFKDALEYSEKAAAVAPHYLEGLFTHAKMLAAAGQAKLAAEVLSEVIDQGRVYALKAAMDPDLGTKSPVLAKLEEHRLRAKEAASAAISKAQEELAYLTFLWARARQVNVAPPSTEECRLHAIDKFIKEAQALFSCQTFFSLLESAEACNAAMKLCLESREACVEALRGLESDLQRELNALHQEITQNIKMESRRERLKQNADMLVRALEGSYEFSAPLGCLCYFISFLVFLILALPLGLIDTMGGFNMGIFMLVPLVSAVPVAAIYFHFEEKRKSVIERRKEIRKKLEADTRRMEKECSDYIEARFAREGKELQSTLQAVQDTLAGRVAMSLPAGDEVTTQESPPLD